MKISKVRPKQLWQHFQSRIATADALLQLTLLGAIIGIATGLLIIAFRLAITWPLTLLLDGQPDGFEQLPLIGRFMLPVMGTAIIGYWLYKRPTQARSVGITHVLDRLHNHQGQLPESNAWFQAVSAIIACITGQSTGREGPAIHLGAAIASSLSIRFSLPKNRTRTLLGCGVAGAISASFNVPLAGVIFALEVVLKEYTVAGFIPILMSAALAALLSTQVFGSEPAFNIPVTDQILPRDLLYVAGISVAVGAIAAAFVRLSVRFTQVAPKDPRWAMAILGLTTGAIACFIPQVMGIGYDSIHEMVNSPWPISFILLFIVLKLCLTAMACGFGLPGGIIGPTLILGTATGVSFGLLAQAWVPHAAAELGFYALMGMGAMMAAVLQAPLAALVTLLEMTQNSNLLMPSMLATVIASMVTSEVFCHRSIFIELLHAKGINLEQHPTLTLLRNTSVTALMKHNYIQVPNNIQLSQITHCLAKDPEWLLINTEYPQYVLMPAVALAIILEDKDRLKEYIDQDSQSINLDQIPAERYYARAISYRAHLEDALNTMMEYQIEAVAIEAHWHHRQEPIGILLHDQINHFYQLTPRSVT